MFEKTEIEIESDEVVQERAAQDVGNVFSWTSGESVGRKIELLSGRIFASCRVCGVRFEVVRPWSIDLAGHVVVPKVFATVSDGERSVREETDVFLCPRDLKAHLEKLVVRRVVPPAPPKPKAWHMESAHGRYHGIGKDAAEAYDSLPKDRRRAIRREDWMTTAVECKGV